MKHLVLLLIVILSSYGAWAVATKKDRKKVMGLTMSHGLKIGLIVLAILVLMFSATAYKSISIV